MSSLDQESLRLPTTIERTLETPEVPHVNDPYGVHARARMQTEKAIKEEQEDAQISNLEDAMARIEQLRAIINHREVGLETNWRFEQTFMGVYGGWPRMFISDWENTLSSMEWNAYTWALNFAFQPRWNRYDHISQDQKRDIIASLKGWIVQDDFDLIISKFPPVIRLAALKHLTAISILKHCFEVFFENPFWYLDPDDEYKRDSNVTCTTFATHLNVLHKKFLSVVPELAHHWRAQTVRLANTIQLSPYALEGDRAYGVANEEIIKEKAYQLAAAKLNDPAFQCLLQDPTDAKLPDALGDVYHRFAEKARLMSTMHPYITWKTLDSPENDPLRPKFTRSDKTMEPVYMWPLGPRESRLNGREVLAIRFPYVVRGKDWDLLGAKSYLLMKAQVYIDDPIGHPRDSYEEDDNPYDPSRKKRIKQVAKEKKKLGGNWDRSISQPIKVKKTGSAKKKKK
ncbi:hypothetical protein N7466_002041 [Penicillium verhagenii]|uniref:uncharacterized protein n=1 Tax=Penicillium verhagenii TaxID=1562060 RepID=UPI0025452170|nr:uncharacterized protein N7466_002041 [Penicillium verhagenii]KAJ5938907.1 hypothetical protein N7466_002041 [Penicillium verhagenii]